jgi:hypothetical protein
VETYRTKEQIKLPNDVILVEGHVYPASAFGPWAQSLVRAGAIEKIEPEPEPEPTPEPIETAKKKKEGKL